MRSAMKREKCQTNHTIPKQQRPLKQLFCGVNPICRRQKTHSFGSTSGARRQADTLHPHQCADQRARASQIRDPSGQHRTLRHFCGVKPICRRQKTHSFGSTSGARRQADTLHPHQCADQRARASQIRDQSGQHRTLRHRVWMSHSRHVTSLPQARSLRCRSRPVCEAVCEVHCFRRAGSKPILFRCCRPSRPCKPKPCFS